MSCRWRQAPFRKDKKINPPFRVTWHPQISCVSLTDLPFLYITLWCPRRGDKQGASRPLPHQVHQGMSQNQGVQQEQKEARQGCPYKAARTGALGWAVTGSWTLDKVGRLQGRACFFIFNGCLYQLLLYSEFKLQMHLGTVQSYSPCLQMGF